MRRADVQGLRGIAVLLVVAYHAGWHVPGGFTGVDVFFVISGWVITASLLPELRASGRIDLRAFYARRIRRLLPALAVLLLVVALVGTVAAPVSAQRTGALTGVWASFFAANLFLYRVGTGYFAPGATLDPLLHTWTLAVEEQFYVVFPTLLVVGWRFRQRRGALVAVGALSLASFALALLLGGGPNEPSATGRFAFYGSPTRACEFGAGALLALTSRGLPQRVREGVGLVGLALIGYAGFTFDGSAGIPGWETLLPVAGATAVIAADRSLAARVLSVRPLTWIGDLSYSWYLWHWPLIVFARALGSGLGSWAAVVSLVPAWLSYRYVELPFRTSRRFRGRATAVVALAAVLVPAAASAGLVLVQSRLERTAAIERWNAAHEPHADFLRGCESETPLGARAGPRWQACRWPADGARGTVYLLGDSNAGHFTEGFAAGANASGYTAVVAAYAGCPFIDLRVDGTVVGVGPCRSFDSRSFDWLLRDRPSLVVIANRADGFIAHDSKRLASDDGGFTSSATAKRQLWEAALRSMLARLDARGIPTIVVHPVPWIGAMNDSCAVIRVLQNGCNAEVSRQSAERERRDAVRLEQRAAASLAHVSTADFADVFCDARRCSSVRGGVVAYQDRDHLSVAGSEMLTARFAKLVRVHAVPARNQLG